MMTTIRRITLCCALLSGLALPSFAQTTGRSIGNYTYDASGNVESIGPDTDGLTSFYEYDSAGRLIRFHRKTAGGSTVLTETFEYDAYGNQTKQTTNGTVTSLPTAASTNRLTNATYDAAGNMLAYGAESYVFDPVGTMTKKSGTWGSAFYVYTADDERIGIEGPDGSWRYMGRDLDGKVLREWSATSGTATNWTWVEDYVYRDGLLAAAVRPATQGGERHFHLDHLGSPRLITSSTASLYAEHLYYPFGREITSPTQELALGHDTPEPMKFTGHERDFAGSYTGPVLDYMHARYYNPQAARFLSVDPIMSKAAAGSPLLWNRYAYVGNNPMKFIDPSGRLLKLTRCVEDQNSDACKAQMGLYLSIFGNQAAEAGKYLQVGPNGIVSFKGINGAAFAAKFGQMGQATNYLVSNNAAMFTMTTGSSGKTKGARGAYFEQTEVSTLFNGTAYPGGGEIGIDTGAFPQTFFGVSVSATEALVHEIGHAVGTLFPGYASSVDALAAGTDLMRMGSNGRREAYATAFENAWRKGVLGATTRRTGYFFDGDVRDVSGTSLFP